MKRRFLRVRFPIRQRIPLRQARVGMVFTQDVYTRTGRKIAEAGTAATMSSLGRLNRFEIGSVQIRRPLQGWIMPQHLHGFPARVDIAEDRVLPDPDGGLGELLSGGSTRSVIALLRMVRRRAHRRNRTRWVRVASDALRRCRVLRRIRRRTPLEQDAEGDDAAVPAPWLLGGVSELYVREGSSPSRNRLIQGLEDRSRVTDSVVRISTRAPRLLQLAQGSADTAEEPLGGLRETHPLGDRARMLLAKLRQDPCGDEAGTREMARLIRGEANLELTTIVRFPPDSHDVYGAVYRLLEERFRARMERAGVEGGLDSPRQNESFAEPARSRPHTPAGGVPQLRDGLSSSGLPGADVPGEHA